MPRADFESAENRSRISPRTCRFQFEWSFRFGIPRVLAMNVLPMSFRAPLHRHVGLGRDGSP